MPPSKLDYSGIVWDIIQAPAMNGDRQSGRCYEKCPLVMTHMAKITILNRLMIMNDLFSWAIFHSNLLPFGKQT